MPNIAVMLKSEILRLARKEVRREIEALKKAIALHRSEIAALKRRLTSAEKQSTKRSHKTSAPLIEADGTEGGTKIRFSAQRLAKHREKLGLSAFDYGQLVGVGGQTVYNWESGKSRPRQAQLQALASIRKVGKRQVKSLLAAVTKPKE